MPLETAIVAGSEWAARTSKHPMWIVRVVHVSQGSVEVTQIAGGRVTAAGRRRRWLSRAAFLNCFRPL